jgi:large subunit ribosomal protein L1
MSKLTKKQKAQQGKVDSNKLYPLADALSIVKECANAKFDESIDVAVQLGIDAKKSDQVVRGAVVMPNGTGKTKRVAVFAQGAKAEEAKAAGADIVGMDDLAAMVKAGNMPFDVVIAAPDAMRVVGTSGPDPRPARPDAQPEGRHGDADVATAVKNAKAGQVQFRVDKAGIVHSTIGRRSFDTDKLQGQPGCADRCADQSQAGFEQGCVFAQGGGLVDHGCGCSRRHPVHLGVVAGIRAACERCLMWWAAMANGRCRSSKTVGAWETTLNRRA